jgi:ribosomal protein L37E
MGTVDPEKLKRREPLSCRECGTDVWHVNMSVCDLCFLKLYRKWKGVLFG